MGRMGQDPDIFLRVLSHTSHSSLFFRLEGMLTLESIRGVEQGGRNSTLAASCLSVFLSCNLPVFRSPSLPVFLFPVFLSAVFLPSFCLSLCVAFFCPCSLPPFLPSSFPPFLVSSL